MINNKYIRYVMDFINTNTPVEFIYDEIHYNEILQRINKEIPSIKYKDLICACYSLFYTSLTYHGKACENFNHQPYYILIGDYIGSYIVEILYKHKLYYLLKVFASESKLIMLNLLNNNAKDSLLNNIIFALKE